MNEQPTQNNKLPQADEQQFYQPDDSHNASPPRYAGYNFNGVTQQQPGAQPQVSGLTWEASEYVHHAKGPLWLIGFSVPVLLFLVLAVWTQAWTFAILVVVMGIALGIIAFRPPRVLHYSLSDQGLQIDEKFYDLSEFRAFGIVHDGALYSVMLLPVKRLMPAVTIYFEEQDGEKIVDILSAYMPMEQLQQDFFDKLMHRLRF